MKKFVMLVGLFAVILGCQKEHPISVYVNPDFNKLVEDRQAIEKIAVFPFASALHDADDPDGVATMTMEKFFVPALDGRKDYSFISPNTVRYAVDREGWQDRYEKFLHDYPRSDQPDLTFLGPLAEALKCDAFLFPVVDTWQKDEVDVQENASAATYVGATVTIIDATGQLGAVLFRATDEDYVEGARSETGDRSLVKSSSGIVRSDQGSKIFRAPPFEDVAVKVVEALVASLPVR